MVREECAEGDDDDDLEGEARERDVDAGLGGAGGSGGERTAGGLEDEAEDVGGDEDVVVELRGAEAGDGGGVALDSGARQLPACGGSTEADYNILTSWRG